MIVSRRLDGAGRDRREKNIENREVAARVQTTHVSRNTDCITASTSDLTIAGVRSGAAEDSRVFAEQARAAAEEARAAAAEASNSVREARKEREEPGDSAEDARGSARQARVGLRLEARGGLSCRCT